jgi:hypothetical protein
VTNPISHPRYQWRENFFTEKRKIVMRNNPDLQREFMTMYHSSIIGGHSGFTVIIKRVEGLFYGESNRRTLSNLLENVPFVKGTTMKMS